MKELGRFDDEKAAALAYDRCVALCVVGSMVGVSFGRRRSCIEALTRCALHIRTYSAVTDGAAASGATNFLPDGQTVNPHLAELKQLEEGGQAATA